MRTLYIVLSFLMVIAVILGPVRYTKSDPRTTLLTSEAILHSHTIQLDHFCQKGVVCIPEDRIYHINDHYYHFLPLGTEIASLPFVAVFNSFNLSMVDHRLDAQKIIACASLLLCFFIMLKIGALFLDKKSALFVSSVFIFGTSLMSTLGAALWSHNFAIVFALLAIFFAFKITLQDKNQFWPLLALSLFMAYLCRPSLSLLAPCALLFVFSYKKTTTIKVFCLLSLCLALFMLMSKHYYHTFLPAYYSPELVENSFSLTASYGHLFSPSRGLFIFSPFLLLAFCFNMFSKRSEIKRTWLLLALVWPIAHLVTMSRIEEWWGGYSFGPRYMVDCLPGLFLLMIFSYKQNKGTRYYFYTFILLAVFSIYVNTWQGRFNINAAIHWNEKYLVDGATNPNVFFNWSIAQCVY